MDEAARSIRVSSTHLSLDAVGHFLGGLIAGEGSFMIARAGKYANGDERRKFVFQVCMASRDRSLLDRLRDVLGFGAINDAPPQKAHWEPTSTLCVKSIKAHRTALIPFCEAYLPRESHKWRQFVSWRESLYDWDSLHPSKRSKGVCSESGCDGPVRGRGVCRRHYYRLTGY